MENKPEPYLVAHKDANVGDEIVIQSVLLHALGTQLLLVGATIRLKGAHKARMLLAIL